MPLKQIRPKPDAYKEQLAAGVAHDFNNLILAIRGNTSLLLLGDASREDLASRLNQIDEAAMRAAEITQQLLAFSRASDEKEVVLDFNQVIKEAGHLAARTLRSKSPIKIEPYSEPLKVQIDATRAQQLILNLCVNANDAMPSGGTITINNSLFRLNNANTSGAATQLLFCKSTISDTGTGIPPEIVSRIFDPFFTTKEKGKGTGLGLAICQSIVTKSGGFIEVESRIGFGTSFHLFLPLVDKDVTKVDSPPTHCLNKGVGKVLVVDDLDLVLEFTSSFLTKAGYEVLTANGPSAALELILRQDQQLDLMFTDFNMPDMSGWELIQEVSIHRPHLPSILASGYLEDSERCQIEEYPNVHILNKPYSIEKATQMVGQILCKETNTASILI